MKFALTLFCLTIFLVDIDAQKIIESTTVGPVCPGSVPQPICFRNKNEGSTIGIDCSLRANNNMWYFNRRTRSCWPLDYKGCDGNNNRFCSKGDCEQRCHNW